MCVRVCVCISLLNIFFNFMHMCLLVISLTHIHSYAYVCVLMCLCLVIDEQLIHTDTFSLTNKTKLVAPLYFRERKIVGNRPHIIFLPRVSYKILLYFNYYYLEQSTSNITRLSAVLSPFIVISNFDASCFTIFLKINEN